MDSNWERIGSAANGRIVYGVWRRPEDGAYNVAPGDGRPGENDGGYADLDALLRLKGCGPLAADPEDGLPAAPGR